MTGEGMIDGFSGKKTAEVVGITYRQLDYWARTDLIRPSISDAAGSGSRRRYSYQDLLELRVIKTLLDAGIKLESVREVFEYLRKHEVDVTVAGLVKFWQRLAEGEVGYLITGVKEIDLIRVGDTVTDADTPASI